MNRLAKGLLIAASIGHFSVALLHYVMPFLGVWAYGYFGAPALTKMAEGGSMLPATVTFGMAAIFTVFGIVGLAAAGVLKASRLVRPILWVVGSVYLLRGFLVVLQIQAMLGGKVMPARAIFFSLVALLIGLVQIWGLWTSKEAGSTAPSHVAR
jgi:hypothetical protein